VLRSGEESVEVAVERVMRLLASRILRCSTARGPISVAEPDAHRDLDPTNGYIAGMRARLFSRTRGASGRSRLPAVLLALVASAVALLVPGALAASSAPAVTTSGYSNVTIKGPPRATSVAADTGAVWSARRIADG
jgi:hypothetical protein